MLSRTSIASDFSCVGQFSAKDKSVNFRRKWRPLNKFEQYTVWRGLLQIESLSLTLQERERDGKNGRKRSLLFFNDQLLKIQSYGRVRTMSKRIEFIKISWSHENLQIVLHNLLCFLLYQNSEKVITNIFTIKVWCSSLMCEWFLPSESYDTSGGKLRWWEKKVVAQKEESQFSLSHHFHSWFHKKINL